jgi:hypothetical protein
VTVVSTWYHHRNADRGKRKPRVYPVTVTYDREQADLERAARRLGCDDMSAFFLQAARVLIWLLTEAVFQEEGADAKREQERRDREEQEDQDRRVRARQARESRRLTERERDLVRREQELAARELEGKP